MDLSDLPYRTIAIVNAVVLLLLCAIELFESVF